MPPHLDDLPGIAPRGAVFNSARPLPGQVFALELLTRPVVVRRDPDGALHVTIDRRGVTHACYTSEGKNTLCRAVLSGDAYAKAVDLEARLHDLVTGATGPGEVHIPCDQFPLRWASGGAFPVVSWRGGTWTPFFFRDIAPVGWNIAAGGSDDDTELNNPVAFGLREFVEETIVLPGAPRRGQTVTPRTFGGLLRRSCADRLDAARHTLAALNRHLRVRSREDGVRYTPFEECAEVPDDRSVTARAGSTRTTVRIVDEAGETVVKDTLVCLNILELGIEVIGVVQFALGDDEVLLDGETYEPAGGDPHLIRMPIAMISHAYLEDVFGPRFTSVRWQRPRIREWDAPSETWEMREPDQPSVVPLRPPRPEDIFVFGWDAAARRRSGEMMRDVVSNGSDPMDVRHVRWLKNFARYFDGLEGGEAASGPAVCAFEYFTAGSARSAAAYFGSR